MAQLDDALSVEEVLAAGGRIQALKDVLRDLIKAQRSKPGWVRATGSCSDERSGVRNA